MAPKNGAQSSRLNGCMCGAIVAESAAHAELRTQNLELRTAAENRAILEVCSLDDICLAYHTREEAIWGCCDPQLPR